MRVFLWTRLFLVGVVCGIALPAAWTDTVRLKNGDTLSGEVVLETEKSVSIAHEALGIVEIKKEFIVGAVSEQADPAQAG